MKLDAAWHVWLLIELAVVLDGMLAVSGQCGCCHHYFLSVLFCYALVCLVPIFPICCMFSGFVSPFTCDIAWFHPIVYFFSFDITWCICYGGYRLYFGGGSYSFVYVPPPVYVFPVALMMYIPAFFYFPSCYVLCTYFLIHIPPLFFLLPLCVSFIHAWMKTFGGVYAYAFYHMQLYVCFEICILNILYYI